MSDLLTVREVAAELRVSRMTVYRLVDSRELPAVRIAGKTVRIERTALDEYLERSKV